MRWGDGEARWVRPMHSILALFGGAVVPFVFGRIESSNETRGHRFHAPAPFAVKGFADYRDKLRAARVILDADERKREIVAQAAKLAEAEGLSLADDPALVDEIAGLVEWPVAVMGRFDERFMDVPREVLVTTMRVNQKYLALNDAAGNLAPRFITMANLEAADGGKQIAAGNEYVLTARLSDAEFFWTQDRRTKLEDRLAKLADMVFHEKLGSVSDKVTRIEALAGELAPYVPGADAAQAKRAAKLAKADLVSDMVYEFPELQGIMGRYYALNDGEAPQVAEAIAQHYSPAGPADDCPSEPTAVCVALADKLDTLVGFWAIDEKPTGSRDPFALRRAALGVIRMVLENGLRLPLIEAFTRSIGEYLKQNQPDVRAGIESQVSAEGDLRDTLESAFNAYSARSLLDFFADRLKVHLREEGVRHDLIAAVFSPRRAGVLEDDVFQLVQKSKKLQDFLATDEGANLLTAYRRAANIVSAERRKANWTGGGRSPRQDLLQQPEEKELFAELSKVWIGEKDISHESAFAEHLDRVAEARPVIDAFFDEVTVNDQNDELRDNRLLLLEEFQLALNEVADFSEVEG
jgi:glycyl-tRNA synthetase beta chain